MKKKRAEMPLSSMPRDRQSSRLYTVGTLKQEWQAGRAVRNTGLYLTKGVALRLFGMLNRWDAASRLEGGFWRDRVWGD